MSKKVLIVCYSFPPNPGVGGRKWAKMSKFLLRGGWEVHAIFKKPMRNSISPWINDTIGVIPHFIKSNYPQILNNVPKNIFEKLCYKVALFGVRILSFGNYYDRAVFIENKLIKEVETLIVKHDIKNLVVSGAPFNLLYYGIKIKKNFPDIRYIADIRDSWLSDNYFGFGLLSSKRKLIEKEKLFKVLNSADYIIVPSDTMIKEYSKLMSNPEKILHFPHACDDEIVCKRQMISDFNLVCFGSHYYGLNDVFKTLSRLLRSNSHINIKFYTDDFKYKHFFEIGGKLIDSVEYNNIVEERKVFEILSESRAAIIFTPEYIKDFISTKYLENVIARIPMIIIGKQGKASDFVVQNNLGIFISESEFENTFLDIKNKLENLSYNNTYNIEDFKFSHQVIKFEELLLK